VALTLKTRRGETSLTTPGEGGEGEERRVIFLPYLRGRMGDKTMSSDREEEGRKKKGRGRRKRYICPSCYRLEKKKSGLPCHRGKGKGKREKLRCSPIRIVISCRGRGGGTIGVRR